MQEFEKDKWAKKAIQSPLIPILLALLAHGMGLFNGFTFDDFADVVKHPIVNGKAPLKDILYYHYMGGPLSQQMPTIRPLTTFIFHLEWQIWGHQPLGFHLTNLLMYCALLLLVQRTFRLFFTPVQAMWATAFFAVQGIHVANVASVTHRADIQALILVLLAFHTALKDRLLLSVACYLGALLSKESAIIMPFFLLAYWPYKEGLNMEMFKKYASKLALIGCTGFAFLLSRHWWLPITTHSIQLSKNILLDGSLELRLWAPFVILGKYIQLTFLPYHFTHSYDHQSIELFSTFKHPLGWIGILFVFSGIIFSLLPLLRSKSHETIKQLAFGFVAFFGSYSIISNTFFLNIVVIGERTFLISSLWLTFLAVVGLIHFYKLLHLRKGLFLLLAIGILTVQTGSSINRTLDWKSNFTLFRALTQTHPKNVMGQFYYSQQLAVKGLHEKALWHLALAIYGRDKYPKGYFFQAGLGEFNSHFKRRASDWNYPFPNAGKGLSYKQKLQWIPKLVAPEKSRQKAFQYFKGIAIRYQGASSIPILEQMEQDLTLQRSE